MNRLVLALVVVVLAGAVVAGVERAAEAQEEPRTVAELAARVDYLESRLIDQELRLLQMERVGLPPPDPNVPQPNAVDPISRWLTIPNSQYGFLLTCSLRPLNADVGYYDLWCVRPGGVAP